MSDHRLTTRGYCHQTQIHLRFTTSMHTGLQVSQSNPHKPPPKHNDQDDYKQGKQQGRRGVTCGGAPGPDGMGGAGKYMMGRWPGGGCPMGPKGGPAK